MKIAVTKLMEKSEGIHELFGRYGYEVIIISPMEARDPADPSQLASLAEKASRGEFDLLIFTSALGVDKVFKLALPAQNVRIVSVGPKTARRVEEYGLISDVISEFSSEHFTGYLGDIRGKTIGIARADVPDPGLIDSLKKRGAIVVEAAAYRLEPADCRFDDVFKDVDAVIFTSAKSFEYSHYSNCGIKKQVIAAIGKKTAEAMRKHGFEPDIVGDGTLEKCLDTLNIIKKI